MKGSRTELDKNYILSCKLRIQDVALQRIQNQDGCPNERQLNADKAHVSGQRISTPQKAIRKGNITTINSFFVGQQKKVLKKYLSEVIQMIYSEYEKAIFFPDSNTTCAK